MVKSTNASGTLQVTVPAMVGRQLLEAGFLSADLFVTEEGLLFVPSRSVKAVPARVELPASWGDGDE